jgi:hypothetical protein
MSLYIPLGCCECTASTNPCDLPCFISGVATISGSINITGSGSGNIVNNGNLQLISPAPYTYNIDVSLDDEVTLDSSGSGQINSVTALLDQQFEYAAGVNCGGDDCSGSTVVDDIPTFDLGCPANVCLGGQQYQEGTNLSVVENDFQETNCNYFDGASFDDHIVSYYCDAAYPIDTISPGVQLSYVACSNNEFTFSFTIGSSVVITFSTIQASGYIQVGFFFVDYIAGRPLYAGCSGPAGSSSKTITGSMDVVIDRVIGYINEDNECVGPTP